MLVTPGGIAMLGYLLVLVICPSSSLKSLDDNFIFQFFFFLMIRRPPRSTLDRSSAASDVYKRQVQGAMVGVIGTLVGLLLGLGVAFNIDVIVPALELSLIHISEPTRPY